MDPWPTSLFSHCFNYVLDPVLYSDLSEGLGGYQMHRSLRLGRIASLCMIPMNLIEVLKMSTGQNQQNFKVIVFRTINPRLIGSGEALLHVD